jgi:hypothetical protein
MAMIGADSGTGLPGISKYCNRNHWYDDVHWMRIAAQNVTSLSAPHRG